MAVNIVRHLLGLTPGTVQSSERVVITAMPLRALAIY
jgi:hypothetical protein